MKNKHKIFNIISIVFGAIAFLTIFLGVAQLFHSEFRETREYLNEQGIKEWNVLEPLAKLTGLKTIFGGTFETSTYGTIKYDFSFMSALPYLFIILGIFAAVLKLTVKPLNSRYMNIVISLFLIIGAGLFLIQVPAVKLSSESALSIEEICKVIKADLRANQGLDQYVIVRYALKPTIFNYIAMGAAFIASISSIIPFFLENQFDE